MNKAKNIIIFLTIWSFGGVVNNRGITPFMDIVSILLCLMIIIKNKIPIRAKFFVTLFVVWTLAFVNIVITHTDISLYLGLFFHTLLAVLIIVAFNYNNKEINRCIYQSTRVLCYLGVANIILYSFFPFLYHDSYSGATSIKTILYIFNYVPSESSSFIRNQCVFWEPGVFQIVLNLHLYNILIERSEPFKKAIVPILLILSTLSTTGLIVMLIVLLYWFVKRRKVKLSAKYILLAVALGVLLIPIVYNNIQAKFESTHGSAALRTYDYYMGLEVIKNNPLWGIGMNQDEYIKRTTSIDLGYFDVTKLDVERGNTNTYISVAVMFGIPIAILFILALFKQNIFTKKKIIAVLLTLVLLSEPLFGQLFVFLLCFSSINTKSVETNKRVLAIT